MTNYDFLKKYQELQYSVMFDELIKLGFVSIGWSKTDKSSFWNLALVNRLLDISEIEKVEETLKSVERKPTLYFENRIDLTPLTQFLKERGYVEGYEDSWQFYKGGDIDENKFELVKKVESTEMLGEYLKTFDLCYQEGDSKSIRKIRRVSKCC